MTIARLKKMTIRAILKLINGLSKKRHWYQINVYFFKGDRLIQKRTTQVGMLIRGDILNRREVAKTVGENFYKDKSLYGTAMAFQVVAYIGKLEMEPTYV